MNYEVRDSLIKCLVNVLKPPKKLESPENQAEVEKANAMKLLLYIQQAAACKAIGILANESSQIAEAFLSVNIFKKFLSNNHLLYYVFSYK